MTMEYAKQHGWTDAVHAKLLDLGLSYKGGGDYRLWVPQWSGYVWLWAPRQGEMASHRWEVSSVGMATTHHFDDPLTAALWMKVEIEIA